MGGELGLSRSACDSGGDDGRAVLVADVVLYDKDGAHTALLTAYDGTQIRVEYISSFN